MWRRTALVALTLGLLLGANAPLQARDPYDVTRLYVAERTTDGPARLTLGAGYGHGGLQGYSDGFVAVAMVRDGPDGIHEADFGLIVSSGEGLLPYAYADGERIDCGTTGSTACDALIGGGGAAMTVSMSDDGGDGVRTRAFVALGGRGGHASLGSNTSGWRLREIAPTFTSARAEESRAVGVRGDWTGGGEVFLSATGEGGEHGSVAVGQPPCSYALLYPGAGVTQLLGGEAEPLHICPAENWGVADFAEGPTTWSLAGAVAGASVFHDIVRLVVIDLPEPCDDEDDASGDCDGG